MAEPCHLSTAHGVSVDISSHGWNMDRKGLSGLVQDARHRFQERKHILQNYAHEEKRKQNGTEFPPIKLNNYYSNGCCLYTEPLTVV